MVQPLIPTGTPDRHLSVDLRLLDSEGRVLKEDNYSIKRTVMWNPFIIDLWDTRLPRGQPQSYTLMRYHLLDERQRKRTGYETRDPIACEVFRSRISLADSQEEFKYETT